MRRFVLLNFVCLLSIALFSQIPAGYYDGTSGMSGDALKAALHNIIKGHTELSYTAVKEALKDTDEDPNNSNNVICLYTGWSYPKTEFGNGSEQWNREHTWSKSHGDFGDVAPCGTDLHHLRPTDASVNSVKNNRDFDYGATQYIDGSGPTDCYYSINIWEPRDAVKGDVARMIFYMAVRYEGDNGEPDLEVVDSVDTAPNYEPYYGKLSTLLVWNAEDPVDDWERHRNDVIYYNYQNNRNPFIDHPEFVDSIWGAGAGGTVSTSNLIISEIADPADSSYAKFVELYNAGSSTINFTAETWYLSRQANGNAWDDVPLTGSVAPGGTYVLSYNSTKFFNSYGFTADLNSGNVSGNGDDSYFLFRDGDHSSGTLVDSYGEMDLDGSGTAWEYTNSKAVRQYDVDTSNITWTASEWHINTTANAADMTPQWHHKLLNWNGSVSSDWHVPENWTDGGSNSAFAPDAGCVLTIGTATNNPVATGEVSCGRLTIDSGGTLTLDTGCELYVGGN